MPQPFAGLLSRQNCLIISGIFRNALAAEEWAMKTKPSDGIRCIIYNKYTNCVSIVPADLQAPSRPQSPGIRADDPKVDFQ